MKALWLVAFAISASTSAYAEDNCDDVKKSLKDQYGECVGWGDCHFLTPVDADTAGTVKCAEVIGAGCVANGGDHRTVSNWHDTPLGRIDYPNTFLGYCSGHKAAGLKKLDKNEIDKLRDEIKNGFGDLKNNK